MPTRRTVLAAGTALAAGCTGSDGSEDDGSPGDAAGDVDGELGADGMTVTTEAWSDGEPIPPLFTCDGEGVSPPLVVDGVPAGAASLALVVDDPDAPREDPFVHWLLWNVPAEPTTAIPGRLPGGETVAALGGARQGRNSADSVGYTGPCPPAGGPHTYRFLVHALDARLELDGGATRAELEDAMGTHVVASARLTGTYRRG